VELEDAERFVRVAERDYDVMVQVYSALVREAVATRVEELREARADVLAAQQVRQVAQEELRVARRDDRDRAGALEWGRTRR
jgi:hypothetical protein